MQRDIKISIIGLGYVGLPLAVEFGKTYKTLGFDINKKRIQELRKGIDHTKEVTSEEFKASDKLEVSSAEGELKDSDFFIITVPTPIDIYKKPDLAPLTSASALVGKYLRKGSIVVFESTVFPGCTEEICVPILEKQSGLKFNEDFFCGYSPERINPGDKVHRVTTIKKVTSGSTVDIAEKVDQLYASIIEAGTFKASSIKVAEAAKVIENAQRDVNIAFVNELALIFNKMNIDTLEVLEAASTKWNFLPFKPGIVGGHCIGVDPYYLTYKAESLGYHPEVILSGRRINDNMPLHIANRVVKLLMKGSKPVAETKTLVLGITFKENCPDIRNSKVIDIIKELQIYGTQVDVYDPEADKTEVYSEYNIELIEKCSIELYDVIILAVSHSQFMNLNWSEKKGEAKVYDVKGFLNPEEVTERL
ncbi:MAG: nucleotide sugar dehydrogenase [Bacteroidota bacterium]